MDTETPKKKPSLEIYTGDIADQVRELVRELRHRGTSVSAELRPWFLIQFQRYNIQVKSPPRAE